MALRTAGESPRRRVRQHGGLQAPSPHRQGTRDLRYRGYLIEQLAGQSTFLETTYLLISMGPADRVRAQPPSRRASGTTRSPRGPQGVLPGFRDAHLMPVLSSAVSALSTFYQDSLTPSTRSRWRSRRPAVRKAADHRGLRPQKASVSHPPTRQLAGADRELPPDDLLPGQPTRSTSTRMVKALDLLLIHADHEQNCSTSTVRPVGSSHANLFASVSAGNQRPFRSAPRRERTRPSWRCSNVSTGEKPDGHLHGR